MNYLLKQVMSRATLNKGIYETRFSQKLWKKWGSASTNRWTGESLGFERHPAVPLSFWFWTSESCRSSRVFILQRNQGLSGLMRPFGVSYWEHRSLWTDRWLDGGSSAGWSAGFAKLELGIDDKSGLEWNGHVFFVWASWRFKTICLNKGWFMMLTSRCPRGKRPLLWSPVGAAQRGLRLRLWINWKEELESQVRGGTVGPGQLGEGMQTASSKGRPDLTKGEGTAAFETQLWQMLRIIHLEVLGWKIHVVAQDRNSLAYSLIVVFMFPSHFFCRLPISSQDKSLSSNGGPKVIQKLARLCRENHWFTVRKPQMCLGMWGQNFKARQVKVFRNLCQTIDGNPFVALCCSKLATVTIWLVSVYI